MAKHDVFPEVLLGQQGEEKEAEAERILVGLARPVMRCLRGRPARRPLSANSILPDSCRF